MTRLHPRDNLGERILTGLWLSRAGRADCTWTRGKPRWNKNIIHKQNIQVVIRNYSIWALSVSGRRLAQEEGITNRSHCSERRALAACEMSYIVRYIRYLLPYICEYVHCTIIAYVNRHICLHKPKSQYVVSKCDKYSYICMYGIYPCVVKALEAKWIEGTWYAPRSSSDPGSCLVMLASWEPEYTKVWMIRM